MKSRKKIGGVLLAMALGLSLCGCGGNVEKTGGQKQSGKEQQESYGELKEGDSAPDFTAQLVSGEEFSLSQQNDKVILLNFWASWCGPCVEEMPAFEKLAEEYKDEVAVLAVNCMEDQKTVEKFIKKNGYTFSVAFDEEGSICDKYPSDGIPYTLVIDADGVIQNIFVGALDAEAQYQVYKKAIDAILGE